MTTRLTLTITCSSYEQAHALHVYLTEREFVSQVCSPKAHTYEVKVNAITTTTGDMWYDLQRAENDAQDFMNDHDDQGLHKGAV